MVKKHLDTSYHRPVLSPPESVVKQGKCNFGTFNKAIKTINMLEADRPLGWPAPALISNFRLKEWEAIQLACSDCFFCLAVYNTKSIGTAIIMAFHRVTGTMHVYQHKVPFWRLKVPRGLGNTYCYYHSKRLSIDIHNYLDNDCLTLRFFARGFPGKPDIEGAFTGYHTTTPIVTVQPFSKNRPLYSHKALMPADGSVFLDHKKCDYPIHTTSMIVDDHKGFYPYVMEYDWVSALGFSSAGDLQGFNLTDNQIVDQEQYNENCLWLSGQMYPLPPVTINRPGGVRKTWHITDKYGQVDLYFEPLADVTSYLDLLIAKTKYHGPTGRFSGRISVNHKINTLFSGFIGMGEMKYVKL